MAKKWVAKNKVGRKEDIYVGRKKVRWRERKLRKEE